MDNTLTVDQVHEFSVRLGGSVDGGDLDSLASELTVLETLKHAIEGRQAALALEVDRVMRERAAVRGVAAARQGRGIAEYVARARRISPAQGRVVVSTAKQVRTMPNVFERLRSGELSEHKAGIITREASMLDPADQRRLDAKVAALAGLDLLGARKLAHRVQEFALQIDEDAVVRRRERAVDDRNVTVRPTDRGDGMGVLTALLPIEVLAAIKETLDRAADVAVASGCATSRGQVRADTLAARLLGDLGAVGLAVPAVPITINLLMTDKALLDRNALEPASIAGSGPIPATLARRLIRIAETEGQRVELRRLYADPDSGELVSMESKARAFPKALSTFIKLRDQFCRTPGCGASVAHIDHVEDRADGGQTTAINGQGLCRQCNWAKQVIGDQASQPPALVIPTIVVREHRNRRSIALDLFYERAA